MTFRTAYRAYSEAADATEFYDLADRWIKRVTEEAPNGLWCPVINRWRALDGELVSTNGPNSDAYASDSGDSSSCTGGITGTGPVYQRWVEFTSPSGNTKAVEIQWQLDGVDDGDVVSLTFGSGVTGPIRSTHTYLYSLGEGTGVDDGNDHLAGGTWRKQNVSDNLWSPWFHGFPGPGPLLYMPCGRS